MTTYVVTQIDAMDVNPYQYEWTYHSEGNLIPIDPEDMDKEISLEEARKLKKSYQIGDSVVEEESTEEVKENKFASYMESKEWSESEMTVSMAYKNLYQSVTAVSTGVDINLGMKDDKPPVIEIMFDDEDEE